MLVNPRIFLHLWRIVRRSCFRACHATAYASAANACCTSMTSARKAHVDGAACNCVETGARLQPMLLVSGIAEKGSEMMSHVDESVNSVVPEHLIPPIRTACLATISSPQLSGNIYAPITRSRSRVHLRKKGYWCDRCLFSIHICQCKTQGRMSLSKCGIVRLQI